jgi:hypothetical protein
MTYSEKRSASKKVLKAISSMKDEERMKVTYGIGYQGKANVYTIHAYASKEGEMSYSIWSSFSGMNVESIGPTTVKTYTFDMMSQKTTYTFPLYKMEIVNE